MPRQTGIYWIYAYLFLMSLLVPQYLVLQCPYLFLNVLTCSSMSQCPSLFLNVLSYLFLNVLFLNQAQCPFQDCRWSFLMNMAAGHEAWSPYHWNLQDTLWQLLGLSISVAIFCRLTGRSGLLGTLRNTIILDHAEGPPESRSLWTALAWCWTLIPVWCRTLPRHSCGLIAKPLLAIL